MRHRIYINHKLVAECNTTMLFGFFNMYVLTRHMYFIGKEIPYVSVGFMGEFKFIST